MRKCLLLVVLISSCANLTTSGAKVRFVETSGGALETQDLATEISAKNNCRLIGFVNAETALFPGSYSTYENEVHTALRNRAAKMGANLVVANFYRKPAQGVGLLCPEEYFNQ